MPFSSVGPWKGAAEATVRRECDSDDLGLFGKSFEFALRPAAERHEKQTSLIRRHDYVLSC